MKIELREIPIKEVIKGYINNSEEGVVGYNGKLDIRPKYQREFIYKPEQQEKVINTIRNNFPLNVMYWVKNGENFEVLDGQQRTISICEYVKGSFSINYQYFHNLTNDEQNQILNYKLMIYFCEGNDKEKLDWFRTINISGEKLTEQELRNAIYSGTWLTNAKKHFSKTGCPAYDIASKYLSGSPIRQDFLETAIGWISNDKIEDYMSKHQNKPNANELWLYFQNVINWVKTIFPDYRKEMKGINFGILYNKYKNEEFNTKKISEEVSLLMQDDDITKKSGIYPYIITRNEKYLNIRSFSDNQKREAFERQKGICVKCKEKFDIDNMEADHITPWSNKGKTVADNCQMLCKDCNRRKSGK